MQVIARSIGNEGEGEVTMRVLFILAAISFSAAAFAQSAPPKIGSKPLVQVKPNTPTGSANLSERSRALSCGPVNAKRQSLEAAYLQPKRASHCLSERPEQSRPVRNSDWSRPFRDRLIC